MSRAQIQFPEYIENDDPSLALLDWQQLRGTHWYVVDVAGRDAIPIDKRMPGMLVSYVSSNELLTTRFDTTVTTNLIWTNPVNWTEISIINIDDIYNTAIDSGFVQRDELSDTASSIKTYVQTVLFPQPIDSFILAPTTSTGYYEGKLVYDTVIDPLGVLTFYSKDPETALQIGTEMRIPTAWNGTGSTITNGMIVFIDSAHLGMPSVALADNRYFSESRALAIATHDVEDNAWGRFTYFGLVNDIDLSSFEIKDVVYLGINGNLTNVKPIGGAWVIEIGTVLDNSVTGTLNVRIDITTYTDELMRSFGFPYDDNTQFTISFNNSNRYTKLTPISNDFYYYQNGTKYIQGLDSIQIPDIEGMHAIYYSHDTLLTISNPTATDIINIIGNDNLVTHVYWNATDGKLEHLSNERHTFHMNKATHIWAHLAFGTRYGNGLALADITAGGDGDTDSTAQFTVQSGFIMDEDIFHNSPNLLRGSTIPIVWFSGAGLDMRRAYEPGFAVLTDITAGVGATGRLVYNNATTGTLATVTSGNFVFYHIFATNEVTDSLKIVSIPGQSFYGNIAAARAAELTDYTNMDLSGYDIAEYKHIASVIYGTNDGFDNGVRARIRATEDGSDYIDYRTTYDAGVGSSSTSTAFLDNTDTPSSYSGQGGQALAVNSAENAVEFIDRKTFDTVYTANIQATDDPFLIYAPSDYGGYSELNMSGLSEESIFGWNTGAGQKIGFQWFPGVYSGIEVFDSYANKGLFYSGDYSANYNDLSIPHIGHVANMISDSVSGGGVGTTGTPTINYLPTFTGVNSIGNSQLSFIDAFQHYEIAADTNTTLSLTHVNSSSTIRNEINLGNKLGTTVGINMKSLNYTTGDYTSMAVNSDLVNIAAARSPYLSGLFVGVDSATFTMKSSPTLTIKEDTVNVTGQIYQNGVAISGGAVEKTIISADLSWTIGVGQDFDSLEVMIDYLQDYIVNSTITAEIIEDQSLSRAYITKLFNIEAPGLISILNTEFDTMHSGVTLSSDFPEDPFKYTMDIGTHITDTFKHMFASIGTQKYPITQNADTTIELSRPGQTSCAIGNHRNTLTLDFENDNFRIVEQGNITFTDLNLVYDNGATIYWAGLYYIRHLRCDIDATGIYLNTSPQTLIGFPFSALRALAYQNYSTNKQSSYLFAFFDVGGGVDNYGYMNTGGMVSEALSNKSAFGMSGVFNLTSTAKIKAQNSETFAAVTKGCQVGSQGNDVIISNCNYVFNTVDGHNAYFVIDAGNLLGTPNIGANENTAGISYNINNDRNYAVYAEDVETYTKRDLLNE